MKDVIRIYPTPEMSASASAAFIDRTIKEVLQEKEKVSLALSGGSTPALLFSVLAAEYADSGYWDKIKIFWVDERCVPPSDSESNFGNAAKLFLDPLKIPEANIFRIHGESAPEVEVKRYSEVLVAELGEVPQLDICLLGIGTDGHTASIFPRDIKLMQSREIVAVATHPESGQRRITITGKVINNSKTTVFLAHGKEKKSVLDQILNQKGREKYPAGLVLNSFEGVLWYLDTEAYRLP